ncbi:MAG: hypothetical protein U0X87_05910 [Anaerolineales bacterium]
MESKPDTIKVSANHKEEISANRADLFVTVKGSSLVSGDAAMKKAKEVSGLVEALKQAEVKERSDSLAGSPHRDVERRVVEIIQRDVSAENPM